MSKEDSDSSDSDQYDSDSAAQKTNRISVKSNVRSSVLVRVNSVVADTPRICAKGLASKSGRKSRNIKLLPDSGATIYDTHTFEDR